MNKDYRAHVSVIFELDLGAKDKTEAREWATVITQGVFKHDFSRAKRVYIEVDSVEDLHAN